jgi:serine/threonine protein kinase
MWQGPSHRPYRGRGSDPGSWVTAAFSRKGLEVPSDKTYGRVFAGYRIVRVLGSGGMGQVYLAAHPRLPRDDALKVLPAELTADPEFRARFLREADLVAGLSHPHIVRVHDRGEYEGHLWISMDYVAGTDVGRHCASPIRAEALHGHYRETGSQPNGYHEQNDFVVHTDCLRTGDRCMSLFHQPPASAMALVFGDGN